jgi:drug/metabolite transporter (DMT)-like permease
VTLVVVFALAAAFSNAVNLMTQHKASIGAPRREKGWRLALYLPRQPLWLLGAAAAVGSYAFQALALHNGPMSVVQPILITELVFVLLLRRVWIHQEVARAAWAAVLVVCAALAVFLAAAEPTGGHPVPAPAEWLSAGLVFGAVIAVLAVLGTRGPPGGGGPRAGGGGPPPPLDGRPPAGGGGRTNCGTSLLFTAASFAKAFIRIRPWTSA